RAAEATLATVYDALRQDRLVWSDGTAGGGGDIRWDDDDMAPRRRQLDPQRSEEMDRQFHVRRYQRDLGTRGRFEPGQGLRCGKGQSWLLGREDQDQDGIEGRAERVDHTERLSRSRGRPLAERQLVQGYRQGSQDDAYRRGVVRRRLPDGSIRACAPLCDGADAIREAYRRIPARPRSAGAHAWQRH